MEYRDYYATLGVPRTATQAEIKKAYRRLARELHPDRNPGDAEAERRFKAANEAHAVLGDAAKRKKYDELGANWQAYEQAGFDPGGASSWGGFGGAPGGTRWTYRTGSAEDLGGFSDFFNAFFGGAATGGLHTGPGSRGASSRRGASRAAGGRGGGFEAIFDFGGAAGGPATADHPAGAPTRLADVEAEAEITLAEVVNGARRTVAVDGRRLEVSIPPGISDGARIKLAGGGARGNGAAGDLYLKVRVKPDPRFERRGADLITEVPITLAEALLGGEVRVPTPTRSVKVRIRPSTQNGQEIRLAGHGLPRRDRHDGRGDLIVRVRVVLPTVDEHGREDFRAFAEKYPQPSPR